MMLLAMIPLMFAVSSCSDDNDLPNVEFNIQIEGGTYLDGTLYVVQGNTLEIQSITVTNKEENKAAAIASAAYYWDGYYLGTNFIAPYGYEIMTNEDTPLGNHVLQINSPLMAVGKELATSVIVYDVKVVQTEEDMPQGGVTTFSSLSSTSK